MQLLEAVYDGRAFVPSKPVNLEKNQRVIFTFSQELKMPVASPRPAAIDESESFGMWKDREDMADVEGYVRGLRQRRRF
jgi:hypothetical protein